MIFVRALADHTRTGQLWYTPLLGENGGAHTIELLSSSLVLFAAPTPFQLSAVISESAKPVPESWLKNKINPVSLVSDNVVTAHYHENVSQEQLAAMRGFVDLSHQFQLQLFNGEQNDVFHVLL